jgi:hypothetical protein
MSTIDQFKSHDELVNKQPYQFCWGRLLNREDLQAYSDRYGEQALLGYLHCLDAVVSYLATAPSENVERELTGYQVGLFIEAQNDVILDLDHRLGFDDESPPDDNNSKLQY